MIIPAINGVHPATIFFPMLQREFGGLGPWAKLVRLRNAADTVIYRRIRQARETAGEHDDMLSQTEVAPPPLDLIYYLRTLDQAA